MNFQAGEILYFDKPLHWTSFNLVAKVRSALCYKIGVRKLKVGHAGTLDPLATGVVTICTGKATKRIDELQAHSKEYVATLQLGATTPSFDLETNVDSTFPTTHITVQKIKEVLTQFLGRIEQVPPAFSACKIDGHRAYNLARKGKDVQLKPKILVIDEIELQHFDSESMQITIRVVCSKGTYIRALARDIGTALQSGAHLIALRRTRVGDIRVEDCMKIEDFSEWLDKQEIETESDND
ncbi:MAG: tRNA pseudouridine(55) synthase TruB [Bacteroidaceae bacterium]|jgi:tRNA pseudouridine55 synthase|nr:tRNA pseudouridine(55) synthase TruB [Bacteroidaceae bacterium]